MPHVHADLIINPRYWRQSAYVLDISGGLSTVLLTIDYPRFFDRTAEATSSSQIEGAIEEDLVEHLTDTSNKVSLNLKLSDNGGAYTGFEFGGNTVQVEGALESLWQAESDDTVALVTQTTAWPRPSNWNEVMAHDHDYHDTILRCWAPPRRVVYKVEIDEDLSSGGPWRLQIKFPGGTPVTNSWTEQGGIGASKTFANGMLDGYDPLVDCLVRVG